MAANRGNLSEIDHGRLSSSLRRLQAMRGREDLHPVLDELCVQYGLSHMAFLVVRNEGRISHYPYYCTTYPEAWTEQYVARSYFDIDPVVNVIRWGFMPVDWSCLDRQPVEVCRFFKEARSHDIGPRGLTIPLRGPSGGRCLLSVTSNLSKRSWSRLCAASSHEWQILSCYLHETILCANGHRNGDRHQPLSRRETQCLQLLASGRVPKQIAHDLGISGNAVKLYLRTARLKLKATTSHHAVAKASALELITI